MTQAATSQEAAGQTASGALVGNVLDIEYRQKVLDDTSALHLTGRATYKEAPELRRRLFEAIAEEPEGGRLVVELADVDTMDTAAMAVLVEGLMATRHEGPDLFFCTPSDSVRDVFRLAGLEQALSRCYGCLGDLWKDQVEGE